MLNRGDEAGAASGLPDRRCIIVDPLRQYNNTQDQMMSDLLARAFYGAGYEVLWLVDRKDPISDRAYASIVRTLASTAADRVDGEASLILRTDHWARSTWHSRAPVYSKAVALVVWATIRVIYRLQFAVGHTWWHVRRAAGWSLPRARALAKRLWRYLPPALWSPTARMAETLLRAFGRAPKELGAGSLAKREEAWARLLGSTAQQDVIIFPAAEWRDLEQILELLPALRPSRPIRTTVHIRFASSAETTTEKGSRDIETLGRRLRSGSPFRTIVLHADDAQRCDQISHILGLAVHPLTDALDQQALLNRFQPFASDPGRDAGRREPSLVVEEFGPFVLLVSALWGRVGSTANFDSQTRYLIDRGCVVARVFVDHYPHWGDARRDRIASLLSENFEEVRPHFHIVAERNDDLRDLARLMISPEFEQGSPVVRICMMLMDARSDSPEGLAWAGGRAVVAIANHLPHVRFTQSITAAPVILLTHDLYSDLLTTHGIPGFIPPGPDGRALREAEERKIWREVAGCVNVSPRDHEIVSEVARASVLAKPYTPRRQPGLRPWAEVVAANQLDPLFRTISEFDIMLWGSWHEGNVAGITWFLDEVLPLHPTLSSARIVIVGRVNKGMPPRFAKHPNVLVADFVDRLDDFALRSKVLVIPDQAGSGMSVKTIDAVALGACFACTTHGMRGFDLGETGFRPCIGSHAMAEDLASLLASEEARAARAEVARQLYELNFSEAAHRKAWDSIFDAVVPGLAQRSQIAVHIPAQTTTTAARNGSHSPSRPSAAGVEQRSPMPMRQTTTPLLSAVVCTYQRYDLLHGAIESLMNQDLADSELEIIVVDNSPDKDQASHAAKRYAGQPVRFIFEEKAGLSNARNVGAAAARAGRVAFIDDDAIAAPHWARNLLEGFERFGDRAGIVGGRILPRWATERPAWLPDDLLKFLTVIDWGGDLRELPKHQWLAGCNISYDRSCLMEAGGFSTSLGRTGSGLTLLSNEETDLANRIEAMGRTTIYAPDAVVEHVIDASRLTPQWFKRRMAWQAVSDYLKDPERMSGYAPIAVERVSQYMQEGKGGAPTLFSGAPVSPSELSYDVSLVYDLIVATLAGGPATQCANSAVVGASLRTKAVAYGKDLAIRKPALSPLLRRAYQLAQTRWIRRLS